MRRYKVTKGRVAIGNNAWNCDETVEISESVYSMYGVGIENLVGEGVLKPIVEEPVITQPEVTPTENVDTAAESPEVLSEEPRKKKRGKF
jgi:hypothetical protein